MRAGVERVDVLVGGGVPVAELVGLLELEVVVL